MIKKSPTNSLQALWLAIGVLLSQNLLAFAGDVGITYVKTIGQTWPELPIVTGGGRLSIDEQGNLYAGTPGPNSFLEKISPEGRVIWRDDNTHCAHYGTAVDDKYVYSSGNGYYGWGHLQRRKKESGVVPPGWDFVWKKPTDVIGGVRGFTAPGPLLVDEAYLYILDVGNGELRRLDKETGTEKLFANPVKVEGALDMAFSKSGSILLLVNAKEEAPTAAGTQQPTPAFVTAFNKETGQIVRDKMLSGLGRSAAIAVHPRTGAIFIGEGGQPSQPINKIRIFSADGTDTKSTLGRGGEWQGKWSADAFAFSSGAADISFDPEGGFWSNSFGHRMFALALLSHFSSTYQPDKVYLGSLGAGIAVDEDLNVSLGGNYKLSWSGDLLWTSGLLPTSPTKFPTTIPDWTLRSVYADSKQALFVNVHGPALFAVDAANGEMIGKALALPVPIVTATTSVQQNIYILGGGKVYRTTPELPPLEEYFVLPADLVAKNPNGIAVSADQKTIYLSVGSGETARVYAYTDGALQWEAKAGQVLARHKNILLTANPTGPGVLAMDTADGTFSAIFGQAAVGARPPLTAITGAAIGSKNGIDYLFIASQYRVLVYRIVVAGEGE